MRCAAQSALGIKQEAERILNYLASFGPELAMTTTTKPAASEVLLRTDGRMLLRGYQWDIVCKSIGPGVYRITLKRVTQ